MPGSPSLHGPRPRVRTPCIGVCSTVFGGDVCRGCKRFAHEVIDWNSYSDAQKQLVWDRLARIAAEVCTPLFTLYDTDLLAHTLKSLGIRFHADQAPVFAALELLRALGHQPLDLTRFGLSPAPAVATLTPGELYRDINEEMIRRAEAWFDHDHGRARKLLEGWDGD